MFGAFNRMTPLLDAKQEELSKIYIDSRVAEIAHAFSQLRKHIDNVWNLGKSIELGEDHNTFLLSKINRIKKKFSSQFLAQYPIGQCFHITSTAIEYLEKFEFENPNSIFHGVSEFVKSGGVFKKIWGVHNEEHFQTAIQIGTWYFDIAAETFQLQTNQVEYTSFQNSKFSELTSIEQYTSILENTENKKLYLNTIFPNLWPYFPLFIKNEKNNTYSIPDSKYLSGLCTKNDFELLRKFLENPKSPTLSREAKDFVVQKISLTKEKYIQKIFLEIDELSKEELKAFLKDSALNKADTLKAVNYINFMLKSKSI